MLRVPPLRLLPLTAPPSKTDSTTTSTLDVHDLLQSMQRHITGGLGNSSATPASLLDLPPELLIAIGRACMIGADDETEDGRSHPGCRAVVQLRAVCTRWRDVIDGSLELQYRIALVRDGMSDRRLAGAELDPKPRDQAHGQVASRATNTVYSAAQDPDQTHDQAQDEVDSQAMAVQELTLSDRLASLRRLRRAWRTLDWSRKVAVPISGPCSAYELVGGIFCKTQPSERARRSMVEWWPVDDVESFNDGFGGHGDAEEEAHHDFGSRLLSATWLPGTYDSGRTVVREDSGVPTRDFAMDPSQDLLVLFKSGDGATAPMGMVSPGALELHVRTISTNESHPGAKLPVLCAPVLYPVTSVCVQIVDDVVGMLYCVDPSRPRISIWNWKTGNLVVDCNSSSLPTGTWDFSFINNRALFITTQFGSGSLELFTFSCERAESDVKVDADAHADDDTEADADSPTPTQSEPELSHPVSSLTHVATLRLPPLHLSVRVMSVGTHSAPFLAGCPQDKPFVASNEERIHVLTVQYLHLPALDGPVTRPRVCAFVHNRALEGYVKRGAANVRSGVNAGDAKLSNAMVVPWSEWGRKHSRMLHHVGTFQWLRYVHGQRVVMLLPTASGKSTLQVLDFNPYSVFDADEEAVTTSVEGPEDADPSFRKNAVVERMDRPTRIVMPHVFVDEVETTLPYREVRRDVRGDYSGVMIDDERLIGLKYPAFLTGDMENIDVFTM